jgi:hypothetical protein
MRSKRLDTTMAQLGAVRPSFMIATGIENSYPTIALPGGSTKRVDSMVKSGHDKR